MSQVRVHNFSVSLDGFGTGAGQSLDAPFGHAGTRLHEWFFPTRTFRAMQGQPGGAPASTTLSPVPGARASAPRSWGGASSAHHGPWPDQEWNGWWGTTRRSTPRSLFSPTIPGPPSRWTAAPRLTFSTPAPPRRWPRRARPPRAGMSASAAARPPSAIPGRQPDRLRAHRRGADRAGPRERLWDGPEGLEDRFRIEAVTSPSGVTHVTLSGR